uniref:Major facilitator superfamily (MFS) profile domain-containing protein n=1 Tax=Polytomella parva TaxID=51329 RepID=A0A7S0YI33_9CHLO|mmetsp:Transcript_28006/g.51733  ORF Transcript_28006/g.51733 Transcript_28006/m.51733 type:complete len:556 (+) Transcript_28006:99-1766(+)|eukprot:CAMPEP_0175051304 /NCGR_PEP_ID=MMETSP0052_2-20121109/7719_1 /TAXON_ID=51329 ORGANISM="Polytomella parva, Strain SAG 63-3" /NCGR_SAMPLE_ID=MMETSP0052_2 /ASSEMBLY_ACC=CAM_ASM_000194 /LENGTH=555 /DNA_ID=CAMNT_0016315561 /DNA_START=79 /DNA_END=1746 /DNA_ORIENTATION=+
MLTHLKSVQKVDLLKRNNNTFAKPAVVSAFNTKGSSKGFQVSSKLSSTLKISLKPNDRAVAIISKSTNDKCASSDKPEKSNGGIVNVFNVLSDPANNSKVISLAVGQMLCSIATLIHDSYLPVYVHDELGLSTTNIGAIQGAAQFLCQLSKGVSGIAGDILGSQVRVLVFGTFLTLACKPMFAALSSVHAMAGVTATLYWFFFAKLSDRLSKGIREAPTKAVLNELARESGDSPDAAYGLRQALATAGMLLGSTIASFTFAATGQNYKLTFALATVPPFIALLWLWNSFKDELSSGAGAAKKAAEKSAVAAAGKAVSAAEAEAEAVKLTLPQKAWALVTAFKPAYWQALMVVSVLYFSRFDASFLSLRAKSAIPRSMLPMLTLVNSGIQVLLTAPLAKLSGSSVHTRNNLLLSGFALMVCANACFGLEVCRNAPGMIAGAALLGGHMAFTHATTVSMIAAYMPTGVVPGIGKVSGTAVSFTDLLLGFVLAASNAMAGILSDRTRVMGFGNTGCFAGGASACILASLLLMAFSKYGDLGKDELIQVRKGRGKGKAH